MLKLGIDTGGTFTDFVLQSASGLKTYKLPTTPDDPCRAILQGIAHFFGRTLPPGLEIIHGSTVATNAFLERQGAKTLLVTTDGFQDVLIIGRQNRPRLYDFNVTRPLEIIPRARITGVKERILFDGTVLRRLGKTVGRRLTRICREQQIESVAVCLLHSYANNIHEQIIKQELAGLSIPVTLSSEILPEFREYERLTTTLINAYLGPVISTYLKKLKKQLPDVSLHIQQSNGGILPVDNIEKHSINTILSGPAGGVHGAHQLARQMDRDRIITFDMGGTSTDVSLCDGRPTLTRDHKIDGYPIRIEVMDIHTVGAGGGSLAHMDSGGLLKVGPASAGARPGPVCYGQGGTELTVTDANLFLGRLQPHYFMGGSMGLQKKKVETAMKKKAAQLGLEPVAAALGIIRIVNASMVKAIRAVSLEKGHDPKEFSLVAFGGAAGLHCCELAGELAIQETIIPARAGILSAQGMVFAEPTLDYMQALFLRGQELNTHLLADNMNNLVKKGLDEAKKLFKHGHKQDISIARFLNLRYEGQSYELSIPYEKNFIDLFHQAHDHHFGYRLEDAPLELISIQCSVKINRPQLPLPHVRKAVRRNLKPLSIEHIYFEHTPTQVPVFKRADMAAGQGLAGPALIVDNYTTIMLPASFFLEVDELLNLIITADTLEDSDS